MSSVLHISTAANTFGARTTLDHPLLNFNNRAVVVATPLTISRAPAPPTSYIGVEYANGRWSIVCLDGGAMPVGAAYSVLVYGEPYRNEAWVHRCNPRNTIANSTWVDRTGLNGRPTAVLFVTPRVSVAAVTTRFPDIAPFPSPGQFGDDYGGATWIKTLDVDPTSPAVFDHPIGVWFNEGTAHWNVFYQDWQPMPHFAEFNVVRLDRETYGSYSEHVRVAISSGGTDHVDFAPDPPDFDGYFFYVTPNISFWIADNSIVQGDATLRSVPCDFPVGVRRNPRTGRPSIYNLRGGTIPPGVGFNVRHDVGYSF